MTALLAIDVDHLIGAGMCVAAALWFAVEAVLAGRAEPWDEEPW